MTSSKTELWRLCSMEAAPQIQKLSVTSQAMDWSEMAVARSSFHQLAYLCIYTPFNVSCSSCLSRNQMASLPMCGEINRTAPFSPRMREAFVFKRPQQSQSRWPESS